MITSPCNTIRRQEALEEPQKLLPIRGYSAFYQDNADVLNSSSGVFLHSNDKCLYDTGPVSLLAPTAEGVLLHVLMVLVA